MFISIAAGVDDLPLLFIYDLYLNAKFLIFTTLVCLLAMVVTGAPMHHLDAL